MGVLLRIFLVLLLILSVAALVIGLDLFMQREVLKGRLLLAENALMDVARTIEARDADDLAERDLPLMRLDREQLRTFFQVDPEGDLDFRGRKPLVRDGEGARIPSGPGTMDELLGQLRGRASVQYSRLNDTREELSQTRNVLAETRRELADTQEKLAQTERDLEQTRSDLAAARERIRMQEETIAELNRDKERMQAQIDEQQDEIHAMRDTIATLEMEKDQDARTIAKLMADIEKLTRPDPDGIDERPPPTVDKGHKGTLLMVNSDWNFVVIELATDDRSVQPGVDLFVQRGAKLVGKVRISDIKSDRRMAVGDIIGDWLQMPIREGDHVFF